MQFGRRRLSERSGPRAERINGSCGDAGRPGGGPGGALAAKRAVNPRLTAAQFRREPRQRATDRLLLAALGASTPSVGHALGSVPLRERLVSEKCSGLLLNNLSGEVAPGLPGRGHGGAQLDPAPSALAGAKPPGWPTARRYRSLGAPLQRGLNSAHFFN